MTEQLEALDRLIEAVDAGEAQEWQFLSLHTIQQADDAHRAYHGSLDAAKALHESLLPGTFPGLSQNIHSGFWYAWVQDKVKWHYSATHATPARAWLLAILSAHRAQIGGDA